MNPRVNFFKRLNVSDNLLSRAVLAGVLQEEFVELCLCGEIDTATGYQPVLKAFAPRSLLVAFPVRRDDKLTVGVYPYGANALGVVWLVSAIQARE